ncbi:DNA ligase 6 isoform X1 [Tanacetum coccineum]|uniref:DNA ligase 6 isoform X1 n=1 Tax=Tanacetum coccineum TaxID=301880 RepID=A0ABQ5EKF0_9ASTR
MKITTDQQPKGVVQTLTIIMDLREIARSDTSDDYAFSDNEKINCVDFLTEGEDNVVIPNSQVVIWNWRGGRRGSRGGRGGRGESSGTTKSGAGRGDANNGIGGVGRGRGGRYMGIRGRGGRSSVDIVESSASQFKRDYVEGLNDLLDLVPIAAWYGNRRKAKRYNPFLMACYDPDTEEYQSVCRVMTVFSVALNKEKFHGLRIKLIASLLSGFIITLRTWAIWCDSE